MASLDVGAEGLAPSVPSMLDLVRLSVKRLFPPGGVELYRQIALLTEMSPGDEVLDVASGRGVSLEYFASEFGVAGAGVELDADMVDQAEAWSREAGTAERLQFQVGRSDALPYRDAIFDVAIGEVGLANHCDPVEAVRELVRVTRPGGFVVLVQLVWKAPVDERRRDVLSSHLGARPLMIVEWKRLLREAGVIDVHVEDWSDGQTAFRSAGVMPFPDFAEMFTLGERIAIIHRAWKKWGWRGVSAALAREQEVHRLLTSERILGLDLLRGRKADPEGVAVTPARIAQPVMAEPPLRAVGTVGTKRGRAEAGSAADAETTGLPLFGGEMDSERETP